MTQRNKIISILMKRDGISEAEAIEIFREARARVILDREDPEEVMADEFMLEPDYIFDFLFCELPRLSGELH